MPSTGFAIAAQNLALEAELATVYHALTEANMQAVVLKGFPLLRRLGLPISERPLADNDLLVRRADVRRADALLRALGYTDGSKRNLDTALIVDYQHRMKRVLPNGHAALVEIHWRAFAPRLYDLPNDLEWSHVERMAAGGVQFEVLDRSLTLLHTAAHFVQHGLGEVRILSTLGAAWTKWGKEAGGAAFAMARSNGMLPTLEYALFSAAALGFTASAPAPRSRRARALIRLLPPARLLERRAHPDYLREFLALALISPARAVPIVVQTVVPPLSAAREFADADDAWSLLRCYFGRPVRVTGRWLDYREQLRRARRRAR